MKRTLKHVAVALAAVLTTGFVSAMDLHVFVAGDTIKAAEVNENFAKLADAIEGEKTLAYTARALSYSPGSAVISDHGLGLLWKATFTGGGNLLIPKPTDWDGSSNVVLELYFYPDTAAAGAVEFFIRPRAFDVGDAWSDATSLSGAAVPVAGADVLAKQTFSVPATRLAGGELWHISFQRGGTGETYPDDVVLVSVVIKYNVSH